MTLKKGLRKKLLNAYLDKGYDLSFFDEIELIKREKLSNQFILEENEVPILLYTTPQERIILSSSSFHFLDREEPKKITYNEIDIWVPDTRRFHKPVQIAIKNGETTKKEILKSYYVFTNDGREYTLNFHTANCGDLLIKCANQISLRLEWGHTL